MEPDEDKEYEKEQERLLSLTHVYRDKINDIPTFFKRKKAFAVGMSINEKKSIADELVPFDIKVYYNWSYDLSTFDPTILIVGSRSNDYLIDANKLQDKGLSITIITCEHLTEEINSFYISEEGERFLSSYQKEQSERQEEEKKKKLLAQS